MNNNQFSVILYAGFTIVVIWGMFQYFNKIDNRIMLAGQEYDKCVWITNKTTPSQYLEANGHLPSCN